MEEYTALEMEIIVFETEDVITTSGGIDTMAVTGEEGEEI